MLSPVTPTLATYSATSNNEVGITTTVGSSASLTASQGTGYTLSSIGFQIVRYDMPQSYYQAVAGVLESGAVFKSCLKRKRAWACIAKRRISPLLTR